MKKHCETKFNIARKGYAREEVDARMSSLDGELAAARGQLSLVEGLKEENDAFRAELQKYREKEDQIKTILALANEKAEDIKTDVKLQYALEIERLKIFQAKWTNAYEELKERYRFDKDALSMEAAVTDASLQIEKLLYADFGIRLTPSSDEAEQQFKTEVERLEINQDEINALVEKLKSELKKVG